MTTDVLLAVLGFIVGVQAEVVIYNAWPKDSACGNWTSYGDEKCLTITKEYYSKEEAETMCTLASSRIVRVNSRPEHEFLKQHLFKEQHLNGSVWLGVTLNGNDLSEANEFVNKHMADVKSQAQLNASASDDWCVEMESEHGKFNAGAWVRVSCGKSNFVVCERFQTRPLKTIKALWSSLKQHVRTIADDALTNSTTHGQMSETFTDLQNKTVDKANDTLIDTLDETLSYVRGSSERVAIELADFVVPMHSMESNTDVSKERTDVELLGALIQKLEVVEEEIHQVHLLNKKANEEITALKQETTEAKKEILLLKEMNTNGYDHKIPITDTCEKGIKDLREMIESVQVDIDELIHWGKETTRDLSLVTHQQEAIKMVVSNVKIISDDIKKEVNDIKNRTDIIEREMTETRINNEQLEIEVTTMKQNGNSKQEDVFEVKKEIHEIQVVLQRQKEQTAATNKEIITVKESTDVVEGLVKVIEEGFKVTKKEISRCHLNFLDLNSTKDNLVPVGFIYTQLPNQLPPASIWPSLRWKDVSYMYAGLFFRTVGRNAADFGTEQSDQARHINYISSERHHDTQHVFISTRGWPTPRLYSGGGMGLTYSMRFQLSTGEVRPRNTAVKIWVRID